MQPQRRRFELHKGPCSKFWEIQLSDEDDTVTTWCGVSNHHGHAKTFEFDSSDEAATQYERLIKEKTRKGFKEVQISPVAIHLIQLDESAQGTASDTIGGAAKIRRADSIPHCRHCNNPMALFFQFTIRKGFGLPFRDESHLLAFMCPKDNETSDILQNELTDNKKLPAKFWEKTEGHYSILLLPPDSEFYFAPADGHLKSKKISFRTDTELMEKNEDFAWGSSSAFKVGGTPSWINYASTNASCCCGAKMRFVCQVSDSFGFQRTTSGSEYFLNGNQVVVMACEKQCDPRAVAVVCDN